jgi:hypothetical protein
MATAKKIVARAKSDPKFLAKALVTPRLRHKLPTNMLTPELARKRRTAIRQRQPVVPGSPLTGRDLSRESKAAMRVKYAPLETKEHKQLDMARNQQRDVGGFYDAYLQAGRAARGERADHRPAGGDGGPADAERGHRARAGRPHLTAEPGDAGAQARGATAGDLSQMASNAAAVRQALVGSFVQQQAGQNAAASNYADTQATSSRPARSSARRRWRRAACARSART